jgi:cell division protein FtsL
MKLRSKKETTEAAVVKKKTYRFNILDVLLILLTIGVIFVAVNIISPMSFIKKLQSDSTHTIEYTVEFIGVDEDFIDAIKENDKVMDSVSKNSLGTVVAVDYNTHYSELKYDEENKVGKLVDYADKYNVTVTITADGSYISGEGYNVNARRIAVGEKMSLRFPDYVGEGYCISFTVDQ